MIELSLTYRQTTELHQQAILSYHYVPSRHFLVLETLEQCVNYVLTKTPEQLVTDWYLYG